MRNLRFRFGDGFGLLGAGGGRAVSVVYCVAKGGSCPWRGFWLAPAGGSDYGERGGPRPGGHTDADDRFGPGGAGGDDQSHPPGPGGLPGGVGRGGGLLSQPPRLVHKRSHHKRKRRLPDVLTVFSPNRDFVGLDLTGVCGGAIFRFVVVLKGGGGVGSSGWFW